MPALYVNRVSGEKFIECFDRRVKVPEPSSFFRSRVYDLLMMFRNEDRVDKDSSIFDRIDIEDHIYASAQVVLTGDRTVTEFEGLRSANFVIVTLMGRFGTELWFDENNLVDHADPEPVFTVEMSDYNYRAPFSEAFLAICPD